MTLARTPQATRLSAKELGSYTIGAVGSNVIYALVATYLMFFYTERVGLNAAAVGTLLLVVRVWDGVVDVMIGVMVDNTQTRWGKFRPYLLFGGLLTGAAATACFMSPDFSAAGKLVYAYCTYLVWSMSYSLVDIPYWSLTPVMTNDPTERTRVVSYSRTGAQVGYWVICIGTLPAMKWFGGSWAVIGAIAGVICTACFVISFLGVRERHVIPRHKRQTAAEAVRFFASNRPLLLLMLACLLLEAVSSIRGAFSLYYFKYYLERADLIPWFMACNVTFVIVGCIAAPAISLKLGKIYAAIWSYVVVGILIAAMYFCGRSVLPVLILTGFAGFFDGVSNIARMSCLADCVEYGQWRTGNRAEGLVFSINIFKTKVAGAIAGAIPAYLLAWVGYRANSAMLPEVSHWIFLFFTLILGVASIAAILPLLGYDLTEKRFIDISSDLGDRSRPGQPSRSIVMPHVEAI